MGSTHHQHGGKGVPVHTLLHRDAFHLGMAASIASRPWLMDDLFSDKWEQMAYERGRHFATWLKGKNLLKATKWTKRPTARAKQIMAEAYREGAIL